MRPAFSNQARAAFTSLVTPGPRMVDEFECVLSILLAILLAHLLGAHTVAWAAFTGFVLMRGHVSQALVRAAMRIAGTVLGAALALLVVPLATVSLPGAMALAGLVGAGGLYGALTAKRSYAWLLFGITFEMILLGKLERPATDTMDFVQTRILEVIAGTAACIVVSALSTLTVRRRWPGAPAAAALRLGWHPDAARHAAQAGVTLALLPGLQALFDIGELEGAGVTIMAVMFVPVTGLAAGGLAPVSRRLLHRVIGCCGGCLFAIVVLLLAQGSAPVLIAGTCLGVIIGRHIENGPGTITYVGLQFTLAILVALVPDNYATAAIHPALMRLVSIFVGMALLQPVLLLWHVLMPAQRAGPAAPARSGDE